MNEKFGFIKRHHDKVVPLLNPEEIREFEGNNPSEEALDSAIEKFETKIFVYKNPDAEADAKHVLLGCSQPFSYRLLTPVIKALKGNRQCKGITLVTDGVSAKQFSDTRDETFQQIHTQDGSVMGDIATEDADVYLALIDDTRDSPLLTFLHSAKSTFSAKRIFLYLASTNLQSDFRERISQENRQAMDTIDGIFTTSDFGAHLAHEVLGFSMEKIHVIGDPVISSIQELPADELREKGREKLRIPPEHTAILYLGFPSHPTEGIGMSPRLNEETMMQTIKGAILGATNNPTKQFALIIRPHPRDPHKDSLHEHFPQNLPENLTIILDPGIPYDEAVYASDATIGTPLSTEMAYGPYRGRPALVSAYTGDGMTGDLLKDAYSPSLIEKIKADEKMALIDSPEKLAEVMSTVSPFAPEKSLIGDGENSTDKLIATLLT